MNEEAHFTAARIAVRCIDIDAKKSALAKRNENILFSGMPGPRLNAERSKIQLCWICRRKRSDNPYDNKATGGVRSEKCTKAGSVRTDRESAPSS